MARGHQRDPALEAKWRKALARQSGSGLSVRAFCRREGLHESSFHAWRRTLRQRDGERQASRPAFVAVQVRPAESPEGRIDIELRGGRTMRLAASVAPDRLAAIVHAIEGTA